MTNYSGRDRGRPGGIIQRRVMREYVNLFVNFDHPECVRGKVIKRVEQIRFDYIATPGHQRVFNFPKRTSRSGFPGPSPIKAKFEIGNQKVCQLRPPGDPNHRATRQQFIVAFMAKPDPRFRRGGLAPFGPVKM